MTVTNNGNASIVDNYIDIFSDSNCTSKVGTITGTSGTFSGLTANKTYYVRANASNGTYRGYSSVATTSTYQYPYITGVTTSALTIGSAQSISLYNPLGRSVSVYMKKDSTSGTTLFSGSTSSTSYSFTPTASTLYNSIPTASSGNCVYYVTYGGSIPATKSGTYKVKGNNAEAPSFSSFNITNTNTTATNLTGSSSIFIAGMSSCKFSIPSSSRATSSYGATLDHYNFAWSNGAGQSANYSSSSEVTATIQNGNSSTVSVTAYDKRGQYKTASKSITLISPSHASGVMNTVRQNGINNTTFLNGSITYWGGDWANGSSRSNNLNKVEYRVNKTGSYYDITSSVKSYSSTSTSGKLKTLTLTSNRIQVHANGSSGGFSIGSVNTIEVFVTTGPTTSVSYDNRQKVAEIVVSSGVFGLSRFKSSDGKYHYGISCMPVSERTLKVDGTTESTGATYVGADGLYIGRCPSDLVCLILIRRYVKI